MNQVLDFFFLLFMTAAAIWVYMANRAIDRLGVELEKQRALLERSVKLLSVHTDQINELEIWQEGLPESVRGELPEVGSGR